MPQRMFPPEIQSEDMFINLSGFGLGLRLYANVRAAGDQRRLVILFFMKDLKRQFTSASRDAAGQRPSRHAIARVGEARHEHCSTVAWSRQGCKPEALAPLIAGGTLPIVRHPIRRSERGLVDS